MAIDKNYRLGFRLLARKDVSIEDAIEAVRLTAPSINILRIFGRAKQLSCKAPVSVYEEIFHTSIIEKKCTYLDFCLNMNSHTYMATKSGAKLPQSLEQYFESVESIGERHSHPVYFRQEGAKI